MKLTLEQLSHLQKNAIARPLNIGKAKYWTLDDLSKGRMFSQFFIKKCVSGANDRKKEHRLGGWRGWTKNRNMRSEVRMPTKMYLLIQNNPELKDKYDPEGADVYEKSKALNRFKRDFPVFVTHD